jgi:hypothetical protein
MGMVFLAIAPLFSRAHQFEGRLHFHNQVLETSHSILVVEGLIGRSGMTMSSFVTETGRTWECFTGRMYNGPYPPRDGGQLSESDLNELRTLVSQIPAASPTPPLERLVFVSYKDGSWHTRTCDRNALPHAVERIRNLFEKSFESRRSPVEPPKSG